MQVRLTTKGHRYKNKVPLLLTAPAALQFGQTAPRGRREEPQGAVGRSFHSVGPRGPAQRGGTDVLRRQALCATRGSVSFLLSPDPIFLIIKVTGVIICKIEPKQEHREKGDITDDGEAQADCLPLSRAC